MVTSAPRGRALPSRVGVSRKGTNGVGTDGVTENCMFFDRGTFWVLTFNLRLSSQKCQGVPFSPICQKIFLLHCSGPISFDSICPQPSLGLGLGARIGTWDQKYIIR